MFDYDVFNDLNEQFMSAMCVHWNELPYYDSCYLADNIYCGCAFF